MQEGTKTAPEIRPDCIRRPGNPLPRTFAPEGARPYKVQDGDTWFTLARRQGMESWQLIRFNFPTIPEDLAAASLEVNWYMQEHVGCRLVTDDGRNYRFSSNARPGLIYLPGTAVPAKPVSPKRVVAVAYWRFWTAVPYVHRAMVLNAQSQDAAEIRDLAGADMVMAVERWNRLVRPGGRWDHDTALRRMLALDPDFHFPIEGDPDHEYFYGIWSEIHHGFVASAASLPVRLLETANPIDNACVYIGAELWKEQGLQVTPRQIQAALLERVKALQTLQDTPEYLHAVGSTGHRHIQPISNGE